MLVQFIKQKLLNIKKQFLQPKRVAVFLLVLVLMGVIYHIHYAYDEYVIIPAQIDEKTFENIRSNEILSLTAANVDFKFSYDKDGNMTFFIRKKDVKKAQQCEALFFLIDQRIQELNNST